MNLPPSSFFHSACKRQFEEVIVFVHHFGGSPKQLAKHIRFVNDLGFDAISFQLRQSCFSQVFWPAVTRNYKWGVSNVWEEQLTDIFNSVDRPKILMTFSCPSGTALRAASRRPKGDVVAAVCEGGPFAQVKRGYWNYFTHEIKVKNLVLRAGLTLITSTFLGGSKLIGYPKAQLKKLPKGFPLLSVRAWKDRMVSNSSIEEFLEGLNHLAVEVLSIPEIDHLQGLSCAPNEYKPRVEHFLTSNATKIGFT